MILALKNATLKWAFVTLAVLLAAGCSWNSSPASGNQNQNSTPSSSRQNTAPNTSTSSSSGRQSIIVYQNSQYGFNFKLPVSWMGYTILTSQWNGTANSTGGTVAETGPIISIRNPEWTTKTPRQDIPIMVFTLNQWNSLKQGVFHIGAAPMDPSELGRNNYYVFALPARYNYAFLPGFQEVETILAGNPLQATNAAKYLPGTTESLLNTMMALAKQGKVMNSDFAAKTNTIEDVEKVWGKADKTDLVTSAKGFYATYSAHNVVFGFNKGNEIFEVRSYSSRLKGISLAEAKDVYGAPAYDAKVNGQEIIGYAANSTYKLELVFPLPTNSDPYPVIDHYNVLFPRGTANDMADDPGRQW